MMEIDPGIMFSLVLIALLSIGAGDFHEVYMDGLDFDSSGSIESVIVLQEQDQLAFHEYENGEIREMQFRASFRHEAGKDFPVFTVFADMGEGKDEGYEIDLVDYVPPENLVELLDLDRPETSFSIKDEIEVEILRRGNTAYVKNDMSPEIMIAVHR